MEVPVELLRLNERKNNSGELHKNDWFPHLCNCLWLLYLRGSKTTYPQAKLIIWSNKDWRLMKMRSNLSK